MERSHREKISSVEEMKQYAALVALVLLENKSEQAPSQARIIGLSGELGAGKTTFTQGLATTLGVTDSVQSPTFVLMKFYEITNPTFTTRFSTLVHIDAYRFEKSSELLSLGFEKLIADPRNLIVIEWPERVADILPRHMMLRFEHGAVGAGDNERIVQQDEKN